MQKNISFDPYSVLQISTSASISDIRSAYKKLALLYHPDRNRASNSSEVFQNIGKAFEILSNPDKRALFDQSGYIDEFYSSTRKWSEYFRELYSQVSLSSLEEFKSSYCGSVEEYEDILAAYIKHKGDLLQLSDDIFFSCTSQIPRYRSIIQRAIDRNILIDFEKFKSGIDQKGLQKRINREKKEAKLAEKELPIKEDLIFAIRKRKQESFDGIISSLEVKYSKKAKKSSK